MIQLTCSNIVCGKSFFHDEVRFPKATKVQCPHCKSLQPILLSPNLPAEEDWSTPKKNEAFVPEPSFKPQENFQEKRQVAEEDFFVQQKPKPAPTPSYQAVAAPTVIGWLVIHDEQTSTQTFALERGLNAIGRQTDSTPKEVNIAIETQDGYMSRYHCDVIVEEDVQNKGYRYLLSDGAKGRKPPSTNGTFLNGKGRMSTKDIWSMKDGDTIQAGRTKLVLKLPGSATSEQDAREQVGPTDYFKTIIT